MKLVFCGTPRFAVPTLEALRDASHEIALVVTQPDRPVGRTQELVAPPVKQTALAAGIAVTQPEKIRNNTEFRAQLESIAPDAIVVVAYGRIIPPWMLALPRLGCINLHGSLLPNIAAQRLFNGPSPKAKSLPATPPCCSKKASTPARFSCSKKSKSEQIKPPPISSPCSPNVVHRSSSKPWQVSPMVPFNPNRRTTRLPRSLRCSRAKTAR